MTKYTRSLKSLRVILQDICQAQALTIDSKAILLVLAATMEPARFMRLLSDIPGLDAIRFKLMEVNSLRMMYGNMYRDYIIATAIQETKHPVSSDELQNLLFLAANRSEQDAPTTVEQALIIEKLEADKDWHSQIDPAMFAACKNSANEFLLRNLSSTTNDYSRVIQDAYLYCRQTEQPMFAYYAVIYAMAEILEVSGLATKHALVYSYRLAQHALREFMHHEEPNAKNQILHVFAKQSSVNS